MTMVSQQTDDDAHIELTLEDLLTPRRKSKRSSIARLHGSMSALQIADEAPSFGATRLTGPARFNEAATTSERRKRLASMRIQHCKEKTNKELSKSFGCLDWESGDSDHSGGGRSSSNGSFRGLFRKSSSKGKMFDSFSSLEGDSNHNSSRDEAPEVSNQDKVKVHKSARKQRHPSRSAERTHKREMADLLMKNAVDINDMCIGPVEQKDKCKQKGDSNPKPADQGHPQDDKKDLKQTDKKDQRVPQDKRKRKDDSAPKQADQGHPQDDKNAQKQTSKKDLKVPAHSSRSAVLEHTNMIPKEIPLKRPSMPDRTSRKSTSTRKMGTPKKSSANSSKKKNHSSKYLALENDSSKGSASERRRRDPPKPPVRSLSPTPGDTKSAHITRRSLARTRSGSTKTTRRNDPRRSLSPSRSSRKLLISSNAPPPPRRISRNPSRLHCHLLPNIRSNQDGRPALMRTRSGDVVRGRPLLQRAQSVRAAQTNASLSCRNLPSRGEDGGKNSSEEGARRPPLLRTRSGEVRSTRSAARATTCLQLMGDGGVMKHSSHLVSSQSLLPRAEKSKENGKASKYTGKEDTARSQLQRPAIRRTKSGSNRVATTIRSDAALLRRTKSGTGRARSHHPVLAKDDCVGTDVIDKKKEDPTKSKRPALFRNKTCGSMPVQFPAVANPSARHPPLRSQSGETSGLSCQPFLTSPQAA